MMRLVSALTLILTCALGAQTVPDASNGWGYGYDSLLRDLGEWRKSPFVRVDSIGASVQDRAIWMVSISDGEDSLGAGPDPAARKRRVFMHARTHPSEVQANHVANQAIRYLLDTGSMAGDLRRGFIFNFIPMYNPDGVELGYPRENAHMVDIESNWNKPVLEPEVAVLKRQFESFMAGPIPVEVALNLHSDKVHCTRFFFFHFAGGTSPAYEDLQRQYIGRVQGYFPGGIEDWNYIQSWPDSTETKYPEGFWWKGFRENVLALTYEDANCESASGYDSTARALVLGSAGYVRDRMAAGARRLARVETRMLLVAGGVRIPMGPAAARWEVLDVRGRSLAAGKVGPGEAFLPFSELPPAPIRILSLSREGAGIERIRLPIAIR